MTTEHSTHQGGTHLVRMLQLASPGLPVGGFSYSQGLEYAVECGWVDGVDNFRDWLTGIAGDSLERLELPVLVRLINAIQNESEGEFTWWVDFLLASRETRELRDEEIARGRAMRQVLKSLGLEVDAHYREAIGRSQLAGFAWAAAKWQIPVDQLAIAYAFSWLENTVTAGLKLIPLGQSDGQRLIASIGATLPERVLRSLAIIDADVGSSSPALAIASSLHETQYTRLFRS
jgi:urease accessory protein